MRLAQLPTGTYETRAAFAFRGGAFRDKRNFASAAVLISHPGGDLLIDAGFGEHADEHIAMLPAFRRSTHALGRSVSAQLDAAGYERSRLRGVLLTHSHWDHVSGLDDLHVPVYMSPGEREYAAKAKDDRVFAHVAAGHEIREIAFDGPAYLGFAASHDFYGDGSVVVVPAAGHTTGSVVVFVTLPSRQRYAFIGDLTWQLDAVERGVDRPWLMRKLADSDPAQIRTDLARIVAIADRFQVVPAHDTRGYLAIPTLIGRALQ
jgi:glyoxylase-like metal-dependent hydrolase (beta-lactamase superfamily II)